MDSIVEHNQALQQNGLFSREDLEANRQGRYSASQLKRFEEQRAFIRGSVGKYEQRTPWISLLFGVGLILFGIVLYLVGALDMFREVLGSLFLPVMLGVLGLALFFVLVVVPRQYRASVDMYRAMGTPLAEEPPGAIQVIEARAEVYDSQSGINRRGHQSAKISHVLQMGSIKFLISGSLRQVIQPKRSYRVYAVNDQGAWVLLSMEAVE